MRALAPVLTILAFVSLAVLSKPLASHASVLTFDIENTAHTSFAYTTTSPGNRLSVFPGYGNNVTAGELGTVSGPHSTPSASWGTTSDYGYGAGGGATPDVTVQYLVAGSVSSPGSNGNPGGYIAGDGTSNDYGLYEHSPVPADGFEEIRFTPSGDYSVRLDSFQSDTFAHNILNNQTLKIVEDYATSPVLLWGSDLNNTLHATQSWTPAVSVGPGHTLSLIYGNSGDLLVENVQFSEFVPEPSTALSLGMGGLLLVRRRRNG